MSSRLLCVGNDVETRCAALSRSGYNVKLTALPEAQTLLRTEEFDLVIVSAWLSDQIIESAGKTLVLVLDELTLPDKLLAQVECLLVVVACTELSVLREHYKRMTTVWARHMRPGSELRREASFAMDLALRLLDLHRYWCPRCRKMAD